MELRERCRRLEDGPGIKGLHLPSETDLARFQTTTWSCSWGSSSLLVKWVKEVAMTPVTSSSTMPPAPERE